jgi:Cu-Zn family superoxide dismutase
MKNTKAISILAPNDSGISGTILFERESQNVIRISYDINGLTDGLHGFHIHKYGDLSDGCQSACDHFNPYNKNHGGLKSDQRHLGDLGNISSNNKICKGSLKVPDLGLDYLDDNCIIGRMIIIHEDRDDLGKGKGKYEKESLKTGNAGKRVACGVIGLKK